MKVYGLLQIFGNKNRILTYKTMTTEELIEKILMYFLFAFMFTFMFILPICYEIAENITYKRKLKQLKKAGMA